MKNENLKSKKTKEINDLFSKLYEYPSNEDTQVKSEKETDIDPEDISKNKEFIIIDKKKSWSERKYKQDKLGSNLDIPGSERDDK